MTTSGELTLDHILDFLSVDKETRTIKVTPTLTSGLGIDNRKTHPCTAAKPQPSHRRPSDYYKIYQEEENKLAAQVSVRQLTVDVPGTGTMLVKDLDDIESNTVGTAEPVSSLLDGDSGHIYRTYITPNHVYDPNLIITPFKEKIICLTEYNQVVVIQGCTGSGKTTQVPQYILDHYASMQRHCNIVITQPRRIAAISVAKRVCQERQWDIGSIVGYQVSLDNVTSPDTRISYVTTGVLLQKLISNRRMDMYTHVIIDEVHERDQDTDFCLLLVRKLLRTNSRGVKVILMSATFDTNQFAEYFSIPVRGHLDPAPVFEIPGNTRFVPEYYLDDLKNLGIKPEFDAMVPGIPSESYILVYKLLRIFDKIEAQEQQNDSETLSFIRGSALVFLPGYEEIGKMRDCLREEQTSRRWWIIPLHSTITSEEQSQVFMNAQRGYRKIILSTNIAESSITVPDIKYVIDFCLTKNLMSDPDTNYTCLQLDWAAKSNCIQRKGRAGRVSDGRCYRMVPKDFYDRFLLDYGIPEMKRSPLEQLVLMSKKFDMGEPKAVLALAIDPPELHDIEKAILVLKEVGALAVTANGYVTPHDGDLTFVGQVMAQLPLDVKISKLILLGYACNCLEECLIIAASLSLKDFFAKPFQQFLEAYKSRLAWANGTFSDCLAYLHAYKVWQEYKQYGHFRARNNQKEVLWGKTNFVQVKKIREVELLVEELKRRLSVFNINVTDKPKQPSAEDILIIKLLIAGAFYPNYFVQEEIDEKEVTKQVSNKDPLATVEVKGLPANQGQLYVSALRNMLHCCSPNMTIYFEEAKALVEFHRSESLEETVGIMPAVYLAVKMRQLRMPLELRVYNKDEARRKLEQLMQLRDERCDRERLLRSNRVSVQLSEQVIKPVVLPSLKTLTIRLFVTAMVDCGHFWAQYVDPETQMNITFVTQTINAQGKYCEPFTENPEIGKLVLAPFAEGPNVINFYRATIEEIINDGIKVFFVDYGNREIIPNKNLLKKIDPSKTPDLISIPAQAFECTLCEIRPSVIRSPNGKWTDMARKWFQAAVNGQELVARVYSVVQNVVHLELIKRNLSGVELSINEQLIRNKFAEHAEESYASKKNHELRMQYERSDTLLSEEGPEYAETQEFVNLTIEEVGQINTVGKPTQRITLHGPYSPLESSYQGMTHLTGFRRIRIDRDSVNSVVLDSEPQDKHSQMLVASHVSLSGDCTSITARNTTLMPNIHGLPALVTLLFAPSAEFRTDSQRKGYIGALCGLGCDETTGESLYYDHDIELSFETMFDEEDIIMINAVRMGINLLLGTAEETVSMNSLGIQVKIRKNLLNLVSRDRKSVQMKLFPRKYKWKQIPEEYLLKSQMEGSLGDCAHVLPLHRAINLTEDMIQTILQEHIRNLHIKAKSNSQGAEVNKCRLCGVTLISLQELRAHLRDPVHQEKESKLFEE